MTEPGVALIAAVELVADTVEATEPRAMRKRLLSGLVDDLGLDAAMLWTLLDADEGLTLTDNVGLHGDHVQLLSSWPPGSTPDQLARGGKRAPDRLTVSHADVEGLTQSLYVLALPEPATDLLGVLAREPISDAFARLLVALGRGYSVALRQAALLRDNQHVVDAMVGELRPGSVPLPEGYAIGHVYRSATVNVPIGGDLYDWFRTDRGQLGIAIGDVSGKGMQAASRAAMAVHSLRAFALSGASPHVVAQMLNTTVAGQVETESFVTLVYARVDPETAGIEFVLAGHPPPVVLRASSAEVLDVASDMPLGVDVSTSFTLHETVLEPGDRLVLFTDGVTEARPADGGDLLELSGLVDLLDGTRALAPQEIADAVWDGIQAYTAGDTTDDCAVVVLGRD
ncbi:MAG: serine/threonine-protein phosphatase [Actinobacteria bacterium]|nr:serine/threonine-protein phosphatase [Actinomycetota bacterium]